MGYKIHKVPKGRQKGDWLVLLIWLAVFVIAAAARGFLFLVMDIHMSIKFFRVVLCRCINTHNKDL